jgi:hypothetical protein
VDEFPDLADPKELVFDGAATQRDLPPSLIETFRNMD